MDDHDQRAKVVVSDFPRWFVELITPDWAEGLELGEGAVDWQQQEVFCDPPEGRRRLLDLVGKIARKNPKKGESTHVIAHIEIESRDRATDVRKQLAENWRPLKLRLGLPVVPLALFLEVVLEGRGTDVYREVEEGREVNRFSFEYLALRGLSAQDFIESDNLLAVAFTVRMEAEDEARPRLKARAMQRIAQSSLSDQQKFRLAEFVDAYGPLEGTNLEEFQKLLQTQEFKEANMAVKTTFDLGIEKGIEKGIGRGRIEMLTELLEERFGPLGEAAQQRLAGFSSTQLRDLGKKLLNPKNSLVDLGLEDAPQA